MADYVDTLVSSPKGEVSVRNDELIIKSKPVDGQTDCAGLGFDSENGAIGKFSWRQKGIERLLVIGSLEDGFTFQQNPTGVSDDSAMKKILEVRHDRILSHVPIEAPGLGGGGGDVGEVGFKMTSADGRYEVILQNHDAGGFFVFYDKVAGTAKVIATPPQDPFLRNK